MSATNGGLKLHSVPQFTAEDVTNLAQTAAFLVQACGSAGDANAGLEAASILGDLAKRIAQSLPLSEQLRLTPPPLRMAQDRDGE